MTLIRKPAVAGYFYPDNKDNLKKQIKKYFSVAKDNKIFGRAVISPHAGYVYSGQAAAFAISSFLENKEKIKRIILFGPAHRYSLSGIAADSAEKFQTPLGNVPVDLELTEKLINSFLIQYNDEAHAKEHSLEVQLPFLQEVIKKFKIVPLVAGNTNEEEIAEVIKFLWEDKSNYFIISSDLSHYLSYEKAKKKDRETSDYIEKLEFNKISSDRACGSLLINGFLRAAKKLNLKVKTLYLTNSGDTGGDKSSVVGYGAYCFI
ncbi:MAG: AmmeMemoRadiSam system protein B [Spirochaetia bacterium]|nr:AmmeMemoRadiSam system protein B [Spirochaetia bacterium]